MSKSFIPQPLPEVFGWLFEHKPFTMARNRFLEKDLPLTGRCDSFHPRELPWHCWCKMDVGHSGNHCCYGCGFEWVDSDPHASV